MKEKLKKCPWKVILSVAVFVVTLALNIWLLCMPVFKGSPYRGKSDGFLRKTTFYDATYSGVEVIEQDSYLVVGFYVVENERVSLGGYAYLKENQVSVALFGQQDSFSYNRKNVFLLMQTWNSKEVKYYNAGAIALQTFYAVVMLVSVVCVFRFSSAFIKTRDKKSDIVL